MSRENEDLDINPVREAKIITLNDLEDETIENRNIELHFVDSYLPSVNNNSVIHQKQKKDSSIEEISKQRKKIRNKTPHAVWEPISNNSIRGITKIPDIASYASPSSSSTIGFSSSRKDYNTSHFSSTMASNLNEGADFQLNSASKVDLSHYFMSNQNYNDVRPSTAADLQRQFAKSIQMSDAHLDTNVDSAHAENFVKTSQDQMASCSKSSSTSHRNLHLEQDGKVALMGVNHCENHPTQESDPIIVNEHLKVPNNKLNENKQNGANLKKIFGGLIENTDYLSPITSWKKTGKMSSAKNNEHNPKLDEGCNFPKRQKLCGDTKSKVEGSAQASPSGKVRHYDQGEIRKYISSQRAKRKTCMEEERKRLEEQKEELQQRQKQLQAKISHQGGVAPTRSKDGFEKLSSNNQVQDGNSKQNKEVQTFNTQEDREIFLISKLIPKDTVIERPLSSTPENIGHLVERVIERCEKEVQVARSSDTSTCHTTQSMDVCELPRRPISHQEMFTQLDPLVKKLSDAISRDDIAPPPIETPVNQNKMDSYLYSSFQNKATDFSIEELKARLANAIIENSRISNQYRESLSQSSNRKTPKITNKLKNSISAKSQKLHDNPRSSLCRLEIPALPKFKLRSLNLEQNRCSDFQGRKYTSIDDKAALTIQAFYRGYKVRKITKHLLKPFSSFPTPTLRLNVERQHNLHSNNPYKTNSQERHLKVVNHFNEPKSNAIPDYVKPFVLLSATGDVSTFVDSCPLPNNFDLSSQNFIDGPVPSHLLDNFVTGRKMPPHFGNLNESSSRFNVPFAGSIEKQDKETSMGSLLEGPLDVLENCFKKDQITQTSLECDFSHKSLLVKQNNGSELQEKMHQKYRNLPDFEQGDSADDLSCSTSVSNTTEESNALSSNDKNNRLEKSLNKESYTSLRNFRKKEHVPSVNDNKEQSIRQQRRKITPPTAPVKEVVSCEEESSSQSKESYLVGRKKVSNDNIDLLCFKRKTKSEASVDETISSGGPSSLKFSEPYIAQPSNNYPKFSPANLKSRFTAELYSHDVMGNALNHLKELENLQELSKVQESQQFFEIALQQSNVRNQEISNEINELRVAIQSQNKSNVKNDINKISEMQEQLSQLEIERQRKTELNINDAAQKLYQTLVQNNPNLLNNPTNTNLPLKTKETSPTTYSEDFTSANTIESSPLPLHEFSGPEGSDISNARVNSSRSESIQTLIHDKVIGDSQSRSTPSSSIADICPSQSIQAHSVSEAIDLEDNQNSNGSHHHSPPHGFSLAKFSKRRIRGPHSPKFEKFQPSSVAPPTKTKSLSPTSYHKDFTSDNRESSPSPIELHSHSEIDSEILNVKMVTSRSEAINSKAIDQVMPNPFSSSIADLCPSQSVQTSSVNEDINPKTSETDNEDINSLSYHSPSPEFSSLAKFKKMQVRDYYSPKLEKVPLNSVVHTDDKLSEHVPPTDGDSQEGSDYEQQSPEMTAYSESFEPDSSLSDAEDSVQSVKISFRSPKVSPQNIPDFFDKAQDMKETSHNYLPNFTSKLMSHLHIPKAVLPSLDGHSPPLSSHPPKQPKGALRSTLSLMEAIQKEEEVRFNEQKALLRLHEQSLKDEAKKKAAAVKSEGGPNVRKRLRAIEIQLREQLSHIDRLIETQNLAAEQKLLLYKHHHLLLSSTVNPHTAMSPYKLLNSRVASPSTSRALDSFSSSDATENFSLSNPLSLRDSPKATKDPSDEEQTSFKGILQDEEKSKIGLESKQSGIQDKERALKKDEKAWKRREKKPTAPTHEYGYPNEDVSLSADSITEESLAASSHGSLTSVIEEMGTNISNDGRGTLSSIPQTSLIAEDVPVTSEPKSDSEVLLHITSNLNNDSKISSKKSSSEIKTITSSNTKEGTPPEQVASSQGVSKSLTFENTFEKSSSDSEIAGKRSSKYEALHSSKYESSHSSRRKSIGNIPFSLRIPLSPRSLRQHRRYSSESDDSFTLSQNETASDISDSEGKLAALRGELAARKAVMCMLKREKKKLKKERIASQEQALIKQIAAYDTYINEAKQELEREKQAHNMQDFVAVKPLIKKPHVVGNKRLSKPDSALEKTEIFEDSNLVDSTINQLYESVESEKPESDVSSLISFESKRDEEDSLDQHSTTHSSPNESRSNIQEDFPQFVKEDIEVDEAKDSTTISINEEIPTEPVSTASASAAQEPREKPHLEQEDSEPSISQESSTETIVHSPKKSGSLASSPQIRAEAEENPLSVQIKTLTLITPKDSANTGEDEPVPLSPNKTDEAKVKTVSTSESSPSIPEDLSANDEGNSGEILTGKLFNELIENSVEHIIGIFKNKENKHKMDLGIAPPPYLNSTLQSQNEHSVASKSQAIIDNKGAERVQVNILPDYKEKEDLPKLIFPAESSPDGFSSDSEFSCLSMEKITIERPKSPISSVGLLELSMQDAQLEAPSSPIDDEHKLDTNELVSRLLTVSSSSHSENKFNDEEDSHSCKEFAVEGHEGTWLQDEFWGSGKSSNLEEEFIASEMARLEEIKRFQEKHHLVLREVPNKPPPPYTPPPSIGVEVPVSLDETLPAPTIVTSEVSTLSLPQSQSAADTIRDSITGSHNLEKCLTLPFIPQDLNDAELVELLSELTNVIPSKEETLGCINSYIEALYEEAKDGNDLKLFQKPNLSLSPPNDSDNKQIYKSTFTRIYDDLLFDLTKEFAADFYPKDIKPKWNSSAFISFVKAGTMKKPKSKESFSKEIQRRVGHCMNWEPRVIRESTFTKWAKKNRDVVDQILVYEFQFESEWVDYGDEEVIVKNHLTEEILSSLLNDSISTFQNILKRKNL